MKLDTSKIEGYAEMSAEDKLKALEGYEFPEPDNSELERMKAAVDKASSEAASYKKALREKQTEEEKKAAQDAEDRANMMKELESLKKDKAISTYKNSYLSLGYDEETAEANAKALHSGDFATVFANQKAFIESQKKAAATAAMDSQPELTKGEPMTGKTGGDAFTAELRKFAGLPAQ